MKTLSIVRHAKAEVLQLTQRDFDRGLTRRGQKDARRIGRVLTRLPYPIEWMISSPAKRTRATTAALKEILEYTGQIEWQESTYLGEAETWLRLVEQIPPEIDHVALIGHNPGMAELVAGLTTGVPSRLNLHFPTAAVAHIQMEIFWWDQIRWGCGQLRFLITPKMLRT